MAKMVSLMVIVVSLMISSTMGMGVLVYGDHDHEASMVTTTTVATSNCEGDIKGLIKKCSIFVMKRVPQFHPSKGCCDMVREVDVPCLCQHVIKYIKKVVSMKKVAYVARHCGKPLPQGTKCGSYTIPLA